MKCARCGKPLTKAAASIPTKNGPLFWGPKCSRYVVIKPNRTAPFFNGLESRRMSAPRIAHESQLEFAFN